METYS